MRQATKRKIYGRTNIAQALRSAIVAVENAAVFAKQEPREVTAARQALEDLTRALQAYDLYGVKRKGIANLLHQAEIILRKALDSATSMPITPDEKVLAKKARLEKRAVEQTPVQRSDGHVPVQKQRTPGAKAAAKGKSHVQLKTGKRATAAKGKGKQTGKAPSGTATLGGRDRQGSVRGKETKGRRPIPPGVSQ